MSIWARLDGDVMLAYLCRLGVDAEPPSADALARLVGRHAERVPYETLWIGEGDAWGIDPVVAARRIALDGRGGYCYHLNGALGVLLESLGYSVGRHVGGVHGPDGPNPECRGNHLVLTVSGVPTAMNPGGVWYVDDGLGDALHDPLPLAAGVYRQEPFRLSLEETARGAWHLTHDPAGGFTGMSWTDGEATLADFEAQHRFLSTSPDSPFVRVPMAERREPAGIDVIRGLVLIRIGDGATTSEPITRRADWFAALGDIFDLRFEHSAPEAVDRLWRHVVAIHRQWEDRPGS
jgi:arylamine N-acetyltransferase